MMAALQHLPQPPRNGECKLYADCNTRPVTEAVSVRVSLGPLVTTAIVFQSISCQP